MTTRLAIPRFGDRVAPRFCFADEVLLVDVDGGAVVGRLALTLAGMPWTARLALLSGQGVHTLLCGGFNRSFLPRAEALGLRVEWGLGGTTEQLVDAFVAGELDQHRHQPCGHGRCRDAGYTRGGTR